MTKTVYRSYCGDCSELVWDGLDFRAGDKFIDQSNHATKCAGGVDAALDRNWTWIDKKIRICGYYCDDVEDHKEMREPHCHQDLYDDDNNLIHHEERYHNGKKVEHICKIHMKERIEGEP